MFLDPSAQRDFFTNRSADGRGQRDFGQISLDGHYTAARREWPNVDHQNFVFGQFWNFGGFFVALDTNSQKSPEKVIRNFEFDQNVW